MPGLDDFDIRSNIPAVIADLNALDRKLTTDLRRSIRNAGESIVSAQQQILKTENPGSLRGKAYTRPQPARRGGYRRGPLARQMGGARLAVVRAADSTGRSRRQMREQIAEGIRTRLSIAKKRGASVRVATTGAPMRTLPVKGLNRKTFRHPVFSSGRFAEQKGLQFFSRGIAAGASDARQRLEDVIREAQATVRRNPPIS